MKAPSGAFRNRRRADGYAGLAAVLLVTGLVVVAVVLAPSLTKPRIQARQLSEDRRLQELANGLIKSIRTTQYIPGATNWSSTIAGFTGLNQTTVEQVYPEFPSDTTTRRVLLIDPGLGGSALPYSQSAFGLLGSYTNLAEASGRAILISNTRRGLSLPVSTGVASSSSAFNAIWDWTLNSATKAPPSGWPSSWNGYGDELHVARINLANLFRTVTLSNLRYIIDTNLVSFPIQTKVDLTLAENLFGILNDPLSQVTRLILSPTEMKVLDGTLLKIYQTNGNFYTARRVTENVDYEFATTNAAPPVVHFKLSELSGSTATNSGTYGSVWNGTYLNSVKVGVKEPIPPTYPSFATNNYSANFDGNKSYIETGKRMTNILPAFTIAAWIWPEQNSRSTVYFAGIRGVLSLNMYANRYGANLVRISTAKGSSLAKTYPYPLKSWHHVAAVGTGTQLQLYVDGKLLGSKYYSTANYYYSNSYTFRIGANPQISRGSIKWTSPQYKGGIDEVVFYDRALSTNEIATLATGVIP